MGKSTFWQVLNKLIKKRFLIVVRDTLSHKIDISKPLTSKILAFMTPALKRDGTEK